MTAGKLGPVRRRVLQAAVGLGIRPKTRALGRLLVRVASIGSYGFVLTNQAVPNETRGWTLTHLSSCRQVEPFACESFVTRGDGTRAKLGPSECTTFGSRLLLVERGCVMPGHSLVSTATSALLPETLDRISVGLRMFDPDISAVTSPWTWPRRTERWFFERLYSTALTPQGPMTAPAVALGIRPRRQVRFAEAISLFDSVDTHFGHWTLDLLGRAESCSDLPLCIPFLVCSQAPANALDLLRLLCPGRDIVPIHPGTVASVDSLIVPLEGGALWHRMNYANPHGSAALVDYRGLASAARTIRSNLPKPRNSVKSGSTLWLRRSEAPNNQFVGENKLINLLEPLGGISAIHPGNVCINELVDHMDTANLVVVPDGSSVGNLLLAPPKQRVILLVDELSSLHLRGVIPFLSALELDFHVFEVGRNLALLEKERPEVFAGIERSVVEAAYGPD